MIEKIVFLLESPFNKRDYLRFGTEILIDNGFLVEFWDFTPFLVPTVSINYIPPDSFTFDRLKVFDSKISAIRALQKLSNKETVVVSFISYTIETFDIHKTLSFQKLVYGTVSFGALPLHIKSNRDIDAILEKILRIIKHPFLIRNLPNKFAYKLPFQWRGVKPMNFVLLGGEKASGRSPTDMNTKMIPACTLDYDLYLQEQFSEIDDLNEDEYEGSIVFLDQYVPFHPEILYMNNLTKIKPEEYYTPLVNFFQTIESALDSKVVIAAHPRSSYEDHPDYFCGRKVLRGVTHKLVKHSKCVVTHCSTSINFAVLYKKPIVLVTLDVIAHSGDDSFDQYYEALANSLDKKLINLDEPRNINWQAELEINHAAYKMYRDSYIKSPSAPEKPCWQIFADYVKTI